VRLTLMLAALLTSTLIAENGDAHAMTLTEFKSNLQSKYPQSAIFQSFDSLIQASIVTTIGNGSRKMIVLLDPYCFYCGQLEKHIRYLNDVTIYTLLLPLDESNEETIQAIQYIWCSPRQDKALRDWFSNKSKSIPTDHARCNPPIALTKEVAASIRAQGTPAIIFGSGRIKYGAVSPYLLESELGL